MNISRSIASSGLAIFAILSAFASQNESGKGDLLALQGAWTMASGTADGQAMPEAMVKEMKRVCKDDETTTTMAGQVYMRAKFSLDASKQPKTIDYQIIDGFTKGQKQLGIYEIDGDTFKSCFARPGAERPIDFTTKPGDGRTLSVWTREKRPARSEQK